MADPRTGDYWLQQADKLINFGLDQLIYKTSTKETKAGSTTNPASTSSALMGKLPYILGGVAVVGIALLMWKR